MQIISIIILTIGILMLLEGIFVFFYPKAIKKLTKNIKHLRKAGIAEIVVAVILILIGILLI